MRNGRAILSAAALCAVVGCFDEPVPAYTQVAPETRVYLKEKGLRNLTAEDVYAQGMVFLDAARPEDDPYVARGARASGAWTNLSARVAALDPASLDYLNLDYLTIGWNVPVNSKIISRLRLSVTINNLATFTSYSGLTPIINSNNVNGTLGVDDKRNYPLTRNYTLGINITF